MRRRSSVMVLVLLAASSAGAVAATWSAGTVQRQDASALSSTAGGTAGVEPNAVTPPGPGRVVPPLELDPSWLTSSAGVDSMSTGVLWVEGTPRDVEALLDTDVRRELFDSFSACFPPRESNPSANELYAAKETCFDNAAVRAAAATPAPVDMFIALRALSLARPDVFTLCHNASHRVGEIAMKRFIAADRLREEDLRQLLDQAATTCQGGLVHGLYDALGVLGVPLDDFALAVAACETSDVPTGQCADAVGHAAWDAFGVLDKSLAACALWTTPVDQDICAEGIVMRVYQRREPDDVTASGRVFGAEADRFMEQAAAWCLSWPSTPVDGLARSNPQHLCNRGVVYLLVKPAYAVVQTNGGDFDAVRDEVYRLTRSAAAACSTFDATGERLCVGGLAPYIVGFAVFARDEVVGLCAQLPAEFRVSCERDGLAKIAAVEAGRG